MAWFAEVARYGRILRQYVVIGAVRKSQFRVEFYSQVVMDLLWYATHIAVFEILFGHTEDIAGWTHPQMRVFLGYLFVSDAFMMAFLGAQWRFGRDLKDGKLDPFRVRPASCAFLYFFQLFSLEGFTNAVCALGYLLYAVARVNPPGQHGVWFVVVWGLVMACGIRLVITVLVTTAEFYLLHSDMGAMLSGALHAAGADRPLDIFSRRFRWLLIYLLPVGALSFVPASLVLGKMSVATGLMTSAWLVLFGVLVFRVWNRGFRKYESAMG